MRLGKIKPKAKKPLILWIVLRLQYISNIFPRNFDFQGGQFIHFLQSKYLPSLNLAPELIQVSFKSNPCYKTFSEVNEQNKVP
jgi:hypothetical protein